MGPRCSLTAAELVRAMVGQNSLFTMVCDRSQRLGTKWVGPFIAVDRPPIFDVELEEDTMVKKKKAKKAKIVDHLTAD